ncbi:MAG: cysteine desulfurase, partial [Pisciglobus halotolerans]|nr:cysteine desulfurase [Pisciglobus halotolerans]
NSATTKVDERVLETFIKVTKELNGNPSSLHNLGEQADGLLQQARKQIAESLKVDSSTIYFTSGGTEGDNWAIKGTALEKKAFGRHLITTSIEHPAVTKTMEQLKKIGYEVTYLPVDKNGVVSVEALKRAIRPDTILVSIMAVNNEVGSIQPIQEISELLEEYPTIHFHVDAVQAIGKIPLNIGTTSRIVLATFSAHKFHGLKGTGFLYIKKGKKIASLLNGGGQENGLRSGTENVAGAAAVAKALRLLMDKKEEKAIQQLKIKDMLMDTLETYPKVTLFSTRKGAPHILCFAIHGIRGEVLVHALEKEEIYVSTTSACSSKKQKSSSTLNAMSVPEDIASGAVRISLDYMNTKEEAHQFLASFACLYQKFKSF